MAETPEPLFMQGRTTYGSVTVAHKPHPRTTGLTACNRDSRTWAGIDWIRGSVHTRCKSPACRAGA
jgi:hypothetical protein